MFVENTFFTKEQESLVLKYSDLTLDKIIGTENATIQQSRYDTWFLKRTHRLTN